MAQTDDKRSTAPVVGRGGFSIYSGRYDRTDHNLDIAEEKGYGTPSNRAGIYQKMTRTLPAIMLLVRLISMPIRSLTWAFKAPTGKRVDPRAIELCERVYLHDLEGGWPKYIGQASRGSLTYGHCVHEVDERVNSKGELVPVRFLHRAPWSIERIHRHDERLHSVDQRAQDYDNGPERLIEGIEAWRLLWQTHDPDSDHFTGTSILRPAYGPWKQMLDLWRYMGIRFHRMAVPTIAIGLSAEDFKDEELKDDLGDFARNNAADPESSIIYPIDSRIEAIFGNANAEDLIQACRYFAWEILSIGMGQFLALGTTATGSRAVGDVHAQVYWRSLKAYVRMLCEPFNDTSPHAGLGTIKRLIDVNIGPQEVYPELYAAVPRADSFAALANGLKSLRDGGFLSSTLATERALREEYDLPPLTIEEEQEAVAEKAQEMFAYHLNSGVVTVNEIRGKLGLDPDTDAARGAMTVPEYLASIGADAAKEAA